MLHKPGVFNQSSFCGPGDGKVNVLGSCGTGGGGSEDEILNLVNLRVASSSREDEKRAGGEGLNLKREERVESRLLSAPVPSGAIIGSGGI